jgi:succinyldiaminopimelate transaminase
MHVADLPDFPWDTIAMTRARAAAHPGGMVDLSVGAPVDPVPEVIVDALYAVAEKSGYPATYGTVELRTAAAEALARRYGVTGVDPAAVLPTIGSKELIALLPSLLGLGSDHLVVTPEIAYPTYELGATLAGTRALRADSTIAIGPRRPALIYLNSPSNPTGRVLDVSHLRKVLAFAREHGAIVASDECYLGLPWGTAQPRSILDPQVCDGDHTGLLAIHSLSKISNLAGYRAGFVAGDRTLIARLLEVRKHMGLIVPTPVQAAMTAALQDDKHLSPQHKRYRARRTLLLAAVERAGLRVEHSEAGLYLWVTRDEPARTTLDWLATRGILAAPGDFYGTRGSQHVRISLTATDERVAEAVSRL